MNPLQQAGSQGDKPPRFASLYHGNFFTGLWTQRSPLNDPATRVEKLYYGGRQDALISGQNIELTNNLTLARRPGTSAYSLQPVPEAVNSFYSFKTFTTLTENIQVMVDGLTKIYTTTPAATTAIFTKSHGAGVASFLGINNWLYIGDGVDQRAWSGSGNTRNWGIAQGGLTLTSAYTGVGTAQSGVLPQTDQGPNAGTAADSGMAGPTGSEVWKVSGNSGVVGLVANQATSGFDGSNYLTLTGLKFFVPSGATINGIAVTMQKQTVQGEPDAFGYAIDNGVYLVKAGTIETGWTDHSQGQVWTSGYASPFNYGSSSDLWGSGGLTSSDVNNSGFGVAIAATTDIISYDPDGFCSIVAQINSITVTVYYTPATSPTWANPTRVQGAPDASYSTAVPTNDQQTSGLLCTNFGLNLSGTVVGLQVNVTGHVSAPVASDSTTLYAQLLDNNGNPIGAQKSIPFTSTSDVTVPFGSSNDLWNFAVTETLVNAATVTITNTALTSNVATYTAANSFTTGQLVSVLGTTNGGGVFNITSQPVISSDGATFTIAITHGNVVSGADSGTAFTGFGVRITASGNGETFSVDAAQIQIWTAAITVSYTGSGSFSATTGYNYVYEYANSSVTPAVFSNPSASASTGVFTNAAFATVGVVASPDPQVNAIWVFRTTDGGSDYEALPTNPYPNVTATINDNSPDSSLNAFQLAAISQQNSPAPIGIAGMVFYMGRVWGFVNNVLYYATGPDLGNVLGNPYESFSLANFFTLPSAITKLIPTTVGLLIITISDTFIVYGNGSATAASTGVSGITVFYTAPFLTGIGMLSRFAADVNGTTIYMLTTDGQLLSLDPQSGVSEIGFPIGTPNIAYPNDPSLATFNPATAYITWHVGGSKDKALFAADGATGWFRCNTSQAPEGGFVWSPKANINGGCQAVQSIETSPGIHQLLIGPASSGQLTTPIITGSAGVPLGSVPPGTYYLVITGVDLGGNQTTVSNQIPIGIGGRTHGAQIFYTSDPRSTSYRVWFGTTAGAQTSYFTTSSPTSFIFNTTSGASTGVLPTTNTTVVGGGQILYRNLSTSTDSGITYPANFTMGSMVLAYPGQMAELAFVTCDYNKIGTSPLLSVLMDEISGSFSSLSGYVHQDPPAIYGVTTAPLTLYANRYDFAQSVDGGLPPPVYCRHLQILVDFGSTDGVQNELLSLTLYGAHYSEM